VFTYMRAAVCALLLIGSIASAQAQMRCDAVPPAAFAKYEHISITDRWFEVYRLPGNVYALWEPKQAEHVFSYLIVGKKRALLFDTGMGIARIDEVVAQLTRLPVIVLNSHTHHDHVGGNYAFAHIYGVNSEFTRANAEQGYSNAAMASQVEANSICPPLPDGVTPATYSVKPFRITKWIHDRQTIDLGGRRLQIIFTPGHTPDSLCLLDSAQHQMFTGDTYYPGALWLWAPETNLDAYQHSIEMLASMAPQLDVLRPAHGSLEGDPKMLDVVAKTMPDIRAGKIPYTVRNGRRIYRANGFSVAMANPQ